MKEEVRDLLIKEYNNLEFKERYTALKYEFTFKKVKANVYFDNYDKNVPYMGLILDYNKKNYYTPLNVKNTAIRTEYLKKIPSDILKQLLGKTGHLNEFFDRMEARILKNKKKIINYRNDDLFVRTMRNHRSRSDLPFFHYLKKVKMSNKTLERLSETMGIDRSILKKIQSEGFTIARTDDVNKRNSIIAIIGNSSITIKEDLMKMLSKS